MTTTRYSDRFRVSRGAAAAIGLALGILVTALVLLDPWQLHGLDERLRSGRLDSSEEATTAGDGQLWTCGMHPNVISDRPGICPICQMDLVPVASQAPAETATVGAGGWTCPKHDLINEADPGECPICGRELVPAGATGEHAGHATGAGSPSGPAVALDPSVIQKMNVRTTTVGRRDLTRRIRTVGSLDYDEERMVSITTRYSGFVEKVWVNYIGQPVRRGDPLFAIYSPELVQTQRELLAAVRYAERFRDSSTDARVRAEGLVEAARTRLEYWEIPAERIAEIEATGEVQRTLTVVAPASGVVMRRMHGLDGMAVTPGMEVIHLADLSQLWLRAELYEHQLQWIDIGARATVSLDYLPGETFTGRVRFIEPEVAPETRTVTVTLDVPNPSSRLRVGMFATVEFAPTEAADALVVPAQSVIRTGDRDIAVVALGDGRFEPREVSLGAEAEGVVEVVDGLSEGDEVVVSAQFLIDSESNLRAAIASLLASRGGHSH